MVWEGKLNYGQNVHIIQTNLITKRLKVEEVLEKNGNESVWRTAVFYHLIHAVLLVVITHNLRTFSKLTYLFCTIGVFLFCGSLYLLAIFELKWLGPITPIGGVSFILAWLTMLKIKST